MLIGHLCGILVHHQVSGSQNIFHVPEEGIWQLSILEQEFNDVVTQSRFSVQSSLRQSSPREKLLDGEKQSLPWSSVSCHRKNFNQIEGSKAL